MPWTHLTDVPELDEQLIEKIVAESDAQADGRSIEELIEIRDDCLVAVLVGLKGTRFGAGEEIERSERRLLDLAAAREPVYRDGWLLLHEAVVVPEWIDYNGHMTEFRYLQVLADATDAFLRHIGIDSAYIAQRGSYFTAETHIRHLAEGHVGDNLYVATQLLRHDPKRLHLFHEARRSADGAVVATGEHMLLHVDPVTHRVAAAPDDVLHALDAIAERQRDMARPESAGRQIG